MPLVSKLRYSVGTRLLIGFWLTLLTAIICVWLVSQWQTGEVEIERLTQTDKRALHFTKQRLLRAQTRELSTYALLARTASVRGGQAILYDQTSQQTLSRPNRFKKRLDREVSELAEQSTPLKITRSFYQLIGPTAIELDEKPYLLFVHRPFPRGLARDSNGLYVIIISLFLYEFNPSLVQWAKQQTLFH